ncbi:hypothetical protein Ddc_22582 [Ditylenchus destructor]|nr:hypothetical protein Ddc_22582 [Ditylenchus destructor]
MGGAANTQFSITSDLPLSADEASIVLRSLRYSAEGSTSLGARTVAFTATDPAGNLVAGVNTTLTVQAPGSPMVLLNPSSDSGRYQSDNVTYQNGSSQRPLTLTGRGQHRSLDLDRLQPKPRRRRSSDRRRQRLGDLGAAGDHRGHAGSADDDVAGIVRARQAVITGSADAGARVSVELDTDDNTANGYEVRYQITADKAGHWSLDTASAKPVAGDAYDFAHDQAVHVRASSADLAGNNTELTASGTAQASLYSISDSQVIEGTSDTRVMHFVVTRSGDVSEAGAVQFAVDHAASSAQSIVGGTAADDDFVGASAGTVRFAAGETSKTISFTVNGDHYREVNDKLVVNLRTPTNGAISDGVGVGTINEVDVNRLQAAYGLRDLNPSSNDYAVRVRRSSDNAETDIGFDANGDLDRQALLDFVGRSANDKGFVTKWYDQSGHGVDMLQTDMTKQGVIVDAGKAVTRADGSIAISFNNGRNGANDDYMVANGVAANDWKSTVLYTKAQSEGNANGSLNGTGRLQQPVPGGGAALLGKPTDVVFEAHAGNTTAGTAAVNYTDGKQVIFDAGVRVASDATLENQFSTTNEWKLAWHGAYGSSDSNYYQQAMYNEFLVFLDKDGKATPTMQSLMGSAGADVLNYNGEAGLTLIDGQGGYDRLAVHAGSLDATQLPIQGIEEIDLAGSGGGSSGQMLTLDDTVLARNGASSLTIHMDAGDAVLLNGTRFAYDASSLQSMVIGSNKADVIMSTPRNDLMIGGAGADTFTWLPNHGGRDTVQDYSSAQGDKLDLGQLLRGFTSGSEAQFLQKVVDVNGNVSLQVDWNGQADFNHADLTIVLNNVHATDPITVLTGTGSVIL